MREVLAFLSVSGLLCGGILWIDAARQGGLSQIMPSQDEIGMALVMLSVLFPLVAAVQAASSAARKVFRRWRKDP